MVKRIFLSILMFGAVVLRTIASVTVEGSKFSDNWSLGLAGGVYAPLKHHAFIGSLRPTVNLTLAKQLTPIFGMGLEGAAYFNTATLTGIHSRNAFDMLNVHLLGMFNVSNFFGGYKGEPRLVELVAVYGLGWGHLFMTEFRDKNFATSKVGLHFNVNMGKTKAWQLNIMPSVLWNLEGGHCFGTIEQENNNVKYNANHAAFELTIGMTYKFANSYGKHNFKPARLYDQSEVDGLNAKINDLRSQVYRLNDSIQSKEQAIKKLNVQLDACKSKYSQPVLMAETGMEKKLESVVTFRKGKSVVEKSQFPNVERIAAYLKNHPLSRVAIRGYASPEGNAAVNAKLAMDRTEAVRCMLVQKYHIEIGRIDVKGQGVGDVFTEPDWNRVSISTIQP